MINFIKEQLMIRKLKKSIRAYTQPDKWFLKSSRTKFVTLAQQSRFGQNAHSDTKSERTKHSWSWRYATVAVVAIISIIGGVAGFADANNVSVTNPLYNFKRISEQARINLSTTTQKVELHQVFARRRLDEVIELEVKLETEEVKQDRINKLNEDFENEAKTGLTKTQDTKIKKEVRQKFCQEILDTINSRANKRQNPAIERIKVKCVDEENKIEQENKEDKKEDQENKEEQED